MTTWRADRQETRQGRCVRRMVPYCMPVVPEAASPTAVPAVASSPDDGTKLLMLLIVSALAAVIFTPTRFGSPWSRLLSPSARENIAYRVDNFFSTKSYAKAMLLAAITAALVTVGGIALWLAKDTGSVLSSLWLAWRFVSDGGEYEEGVAARLVGLVLVLAGMLFFALLIGLIGNSIESRLDDLKQGRNRVVESGHTLLLGWSDKAVSLIAEIAKSKASEGGGVIVVLDNAHDKMWYDDAIECELSSEDLQGTLVVCRSGDPVTVALTTLALALALALTPTSYLHHIAINHILSVTLPPSPPSPPSLPPLTVSV